MPENKELITNNSPEIQNNVNVDIIDTRKDSVDEVPKEVETWLRKIEKTTSSDDAAVRDDRTGQPIMTSITPTTPVIKIPVTRTTFTKGFKKKVNEAGRWLSEFVFRLIKMNVKLNKGTIKFKDDA